jgi:uncharacterized protein
MRRALITAGNRTIVERVRIADTHWTRLKGLLGTHGLDPNSGLWIVPCRQVHMFGMRYAIDVVFLDHDRAIVGLVPELKPWRVSPKISTAHSAIELPAGTIARCGLALGTPLTIEATS